MTKIDYLRVAAVAFGTFDLTLLGRFFIQELKEQKRRKIEQVLRKLDRKDEIPEWLD